MNPTILFRATLLAALSLSLGCSSSDPKSKGAEDSVPTIASFKANQALIDPGQAATLSWETKGARRVIVRHGPDVVLSSTSDLSGALEVSPLLPTTYTLTAISSKGEVSSQVEVQTRPTILELSTDFDEAVIGQPALVRWKTAGAGELILSNAEGFSYSVPAGQRSQGFVLAPISEDGGFTLTARTGELQDEKTVSVQPVHLDAPVVSALDLAPSRITAGIEEVVHVSWTLVGADSFQLFVGNEPFELDEAAIAAGTVEMTIAQSTRISVVATNRAGVVSKSSSVEAFPVPVITNLQAWPSRVPAAEPFALSWRTTGAATVEIEREGVLLEGPDEEALPLKGSLTETIEADTTYVLRATNGAGFQVQESLTVTVGEPVILAFASDRSVVPAGASLIFQWETLGGTSLRIRDAGGDIAACTTSNGHSMQAGTCKIKAPKELGSHAYSLVIRYGSGEEIQEIQETTIIRVVDGPTIEEFTASAEEIEPGETITLSWRTGVDMDGAVASLELSDDQENPTYDLGEEDPLEGSIEVTLSEEGTYVFTLTAKTSTKGSVPAEKTVTVKVYPLPSIDFTADSPVFDPSAGDPVTLSWTTNAATVSVSIYALDDEGNRVEPSLLETDDPALVAAGSLEVEPTEDTTYVAVAKNLTESSREATVSIEVMPLAD